jgi:hypothetical protein
MPRAGQLLDQHNARVTMIAVMTKPKNKLKDDGDEAPKPVQVSLPPELRAPLEALSKRERRDVKYQVIYIVEKALIEAGLIEAGSHSPDKSPRCAR